MNVSERSPYFLVVLILLLPAFPLHTSVGKVSNVYFYPSIVTSSYNDLVKVNITVLIDEGLVGAVKEISLYTKLQVNESKVEYIGLNAAGRDGSVSQWVTEFLLSPGMYHFTFIVSFFKGSVDVHEYGEMVLESKAIRQLLGTREISFLLSLSITFILSSFLLTKRLLVYRKESNQSLEKVGIEEHDLQVNGLVSSDERW
ncbi:MAG: hypothetical protein ACFFD4_03925 [Candidatus Odinarchaeota archaeon]